VKGLLKILPVLPSKKIKPRSIKVIVESQILKMYYSFAINQYTILSFTIFITLFILLYSLPLIGSAFFLHSHYCIFLYYKVLTLLFIKNKEFETWWIYLE